VQKEKIPAGMLLRSQKLVADLKQDGWSFFAAPSLGKDTFDCHNLKKSNESLRTLKFNVDGHVYKFDMIVRVRQAENKKEFETQEKKKMQLKEILPSFTEYHEQKCAERLKESKSQHP
jgi:hypothetical protein